jgi:hypothetical protein
MSADSQSSDTFINAKELFVPQDYIEASMSAHGKRQAAIQQRLNPNSQSSTTPPFLNTLPYSGNVVPQGPRGQASKGRVANNSQSSKVPGTATAPNPQRKRNTSIQQASSPQTQVQKSATPNIPTSFLRTSAYANADARWQPSLSPIVQQTVQQLTTKRPNTLQSAQQPSTTQPTGLDRGNSMQQNDQSLISIRARNKNTRQISAQQNPSANAPAKSQTRSNAAKNSTSQGQPSVNSPKMQQNAPNRSVQKNITLNANTLQDQSLVSYRNKNTRPRVQISQISAQQNPSATVASAAITKNRNRDQAQPPWHSVTSAKSQNRSNAAKNSTSQGQQQGKPNVQFHSVNSPQMQQNASNHSVQSQADASQQQSPSATIAGPGATSSWHSATSAKLQGAVSLPDPTGLGTTSPGQQQGNPATRNSSTQQVRNAAKFKFDHVINVENWIQILGDVVDVVFVNFLNTDNTIVGIQKVGSAGFAELLAIDTANKTVRRKPFAEGNKTRWTMSMVRDIETRFGQKCDWVFVEMLDNSVDDVVTQTDPSDGFFAYVPTISSVLLDMRRRKRLKPEICNEKVWGTLSKYLVDATCVPSQTGTQCMPMSESDVAMIMNTDGPVQVTRVIRSMYADTLSPKEAGDDVVAECCVASSLGDINKIVVPAQHIFSKHPDAPIAILLKRIGKSPGVDTSQFAGLLINGAPNLIEKARNACVTFLKKFNPLMDGKFIVNMSTFYRLDDKGKIIPIVINKFVNAQNPSAFGSAVTTTGLTNANTTNKFVTAATDLTNANTTDKFVSAANGLANANTTDKVFSAANGLGNANTKNAKAAKGFAMWKQAAQGFFDDPLAMFRKKEAKARLVNVNRQNSSRIMTYIQNKYGDKFKYEPLPRVRARCNAM